MKSQQMKTEWGVSGEGGREREEQINRERERQNVGQKWKWHGLEMAISVLHSRVGSWPCQQTLD